MLEGKGRCGSEQRVGAMLVCGKGKEELELAE